MSDENVSAAANAMSEMSKGQVIDMALKWCDQIAKLREAGFDIIQRIEAWEVAVRTIIGGREIEHGMDLTQLRAALEPGDDGQEE